MARFRMVLKVAAAVLLAAGSASAGVGAGTGGTGGAPERLWLAQSDTQQNAGAAQMQAELVDMLKRVGVDYPPGQVMTLDQMNQLQALFSLKEGEASTRDDALTILGMQ